MVVEARFVAQDATQFRTSIVGLGLLRQWEGFSAKAYQDDAGVWTIGYGHTKGVKPGMTCTREVAEQWLYDDLEVAERAVRRAVAVPLNQMQFDALACFAFNIGYAAFVDSTLVRRLNARDYDAVPAQMRRWVKITRNGRKVTSPGLVNRREAEIGVWLLGADRLDPRQTSARPVPAAKPSVAEVATRTDTGKGSLAVGGAVAAAGAALQAAKDYLPVLDAAAREAPLALALVALAAVVAVILWKKLKD